MMSISSSFSFTPDTDARLLAAVVAMLVAVVAVFDALAAWVPRAPIIPWYTASGPVAEPASAAMAWALVASSVGVPMTFELPGPGAAAVAMSEGSALYAEETA